MPPARGWRHRRSAFPCVRAWSRSITGYVAYVTRRERVWVVAQNRQGRKIKLAGSGLMSRAMQHEIDHLDGKLYIDYLDSLDDLISTDDDEEEEGQLAAAGAALG